MVKMAWQDTYDGKRKLWYNAHGICRDCGQREVEPNTQLCFECAERKYKKAKEYYMAKCLEFKATFNYMNFEDTLFKIEDIFMIMLYNKKEEKN